MLRTTGIFTASVLAITAAVGVMPAPLQDEAAAQSRSGKLSREQIQQVIDTIDKIVKFSPDYGAVLSGRDPEMEGARAEMDLFRQEVEAEITPSLIAMANDQATRRLVSQKARANRFAASYERNLDGANLDRAKEYGREGPVFMKYVGLVAAREQLRLLHRIYGDTPEIASAMNVANQTFADVGDFQTVKDEAEEVRRAAVAATRLQPARRTNAALSRQFGQAFLASRWTKSEHGSPQILHVNLVSSGWSVERNEITGRILSRDQQAAIAFKTADGKCYTGLALFEQKHQGGGSYGGTYYRSGSQQEMLCENLP